MEVVETKRGFTIFPPGQKPIQVVVDRRMKPLTKWGDIYKAGAITDLKKREVRISPTGVSATGIGHEAGHIMMGHKESKKKVRYMDPQFILEELEAEYWAYSMGFPHRKEKIKDLKDLALRIGMTSRDFSRMVKEVKEEFKGGSRK